MGPGWEVKDGLGGFRTVWEGPVRSGRAQEGLRTAWEGLERSGRVQNDQEESKTGQTGRVQDGLGGSRMALEGPLKHGRVQHSM